jgi:hypothetical protein
MPFMETGKCLKGFKIGLVLLVFAGCSSKSSGSREAGVSDTASGSEARTLDTTGATTADGQPGIPDVLVKDTAVATDGRIADKPAATDPLPSDSGVGATDTPAVLDLRGMDRPGTDGVTPSPDLPRNLPDLAPLSCASYRPMVDKLMLTNQHLRRMLFTPDGKSMVLQTYFAGTGADDVVLVNLQNGEQRTIAQNVTDAEWLGTDGLLLTKSDVSLQAISLDGDIRRTITAKTCGHAVTSDGARIYYTHDCDRAWGSASVLDVVSGTTQKLDTSVSMSSELVVSPSGRWAAYVVSAGAADAASPTTAVRVVDKGGAPYTVPMAGSARGPMFLSDDALLIRATPFDYLSTALWGHRPGTGEVKQLAQGDLGFPVLQTNADRSGFLVATFTGGTSRSGALSLISAADGSATRLATDLWDYRISEVLIRGFAIAPSTQRVVYVATTPTDVSWSDSVASVALNGGVPIQLASETSRAVVSPYGDRVFASSYSPKSAAYPAAVVSGSTGAVQFKVETASTANSVTFVPGDRGLLYVSRDASTVPWRLRHLSFAKGTVTLIGEWNSSPQMTSSSPMGIETDYYPVDPSGCFTVVDSDLEPAGTRMVLLPD